MKPFDDVPDKLTPATRKRIDSRARAAAKELGLDDLRRARRMSQEALAESMNTTQAHISRLERRADVYISTLRRYIEALGGELRIVASFGDGRHGELEIERFADLEPVEDGATEAPQRIMVSYLVGSAFEKSPPKKSGTTKRKGAPKSKRP
jgi:transcriptional regulator with XRE-family HTH domain